MLKVVSHTVDNKKSKLNKSVFEKNSGYFLAEEVLKSDTMVHSVLISKSEDAV